MTAAFTFPGQGSQAVGMGKALAEASPAAREVFDRADAALGEALSTLCFEGPIEALTLTANTQPALVTTCSAIVAALREAGRVALQAARTRNQEKTSDATNNIADACSSCHDVYRDKGPADSPARCTPPAKK